MSEEKKILTFISPKKPIEENVGNFVKTASIYKFEERDLDRKKIRKNIQKKIEKLKEKMDDEENQWTEISKRQVDIFNISIGLNYYSYAGDCYFRPDKFADYNFETQRLVSIELRITINKKIKDKIFKQNNAVIISVDRDKNSDTLLMKTIG